MIRTTTIKTITFLLGPHSTWNVLKQITVCKYFLTGTTPNES